jgi:cystathionine beta-lyase/cystathionine gamma-synthase
MAAITTLFLSLLEAGDHVVVSDVVYGGTVRLSRQVLEKLGIRASFVDTTAPNAVQEALTAQTRLVFIESPANPTLKLTDIAGVASLTRSEGVLLAVDNTFLTCILQPVFDLGADIEVLSTTKFIEGHNATIGGALASRDNALLDRFRLVRKTLGTIQSPLDAWLSLRGLKTLPLRLRCHSTAALEVARWLEQHPAVKRVLYPGLDSFPQPHLAARQHKAHGGIIAFEVNGSAQTGIAVMNSLQFCLRAENLGATETLITHPASMTHSDMPRQEREALGINEGLLRLSVGLEDPGDIIADLAQALEKVSAVDPKSNVRGRAPCASR